MFPTRVFLDSAHCLRWRNPKVTNAGEMAKRDRGTVLSRHVVEGKRRNSREQKKRMPIKIVTIDELIEESSQLRVAAGHCLFTTIENDPFES